MVGVSSPLFQESTRKGWRFAAGFAAGLHASAILLASILVPVSAALMPLPLDLRRAFLLVLLVYFACSDIIGRTPSVWRQVPQRLYLQGSLSGRIGIAYGLDIGLHLTTQKTTSLLWVAFSGALLLGAATQVVATALVAAVLIGASTTFLARTGRGELAAQQFWGWSAKSWTRASQVLASLVSFGLALVVMTEAAW